MRRLAQIERITEAVRREARRHARVAVDLEAKFLLEDRREVVCRVVDMSVGGAAVEAPAIGDPRERVVAYVEEIGRLEGRIVRRFAGGFAFHWEVSPARRDKLADRLTWIANRAVLGLPEDRRHDRLVPVAPWSRLVLADGSQVRCRILDVSASGAAVRAETPPALGATVFLGRMSGKVVRRTEAGVGIEFDRLQSDRALIDRFGRLQASGS